MSTKCTIAHGEGWRLYGEMFEEGLYLEASTVHLSVDFNGGSPRVDFKLPPDIARILNEEVRRKSKEHDKTVREWAAQGEAGGR